MIVLIVAVVALATIFLVAAASTVFGTQRALVERRLAGYDRLEPEPVPADSGPETAVVQQAVQLTGRLAERAGVLTRVERALEQGDIPFRASEFLFYGAVAVVFVFLIVAIVAGPLAGLVGAAIGALLPAAYVLGRQQQRRREFEQQLPDTLTLLASSLRAGFSFMQGLETVSQETRPPMRRELQRVFTEARLGRPVEDALGEVADRMGSRDLKWSVMAIQIQREVGGNLAALLDTIADTMQKRERIRREVRALTAEGRLTAVILSLMPPAAALMLWLIQPSYIDSLFDRGLGIAAVVGAAGLSVVGWFWLRRIIDIEV